MVKGAAVASILGILLLTLVPRHERSNHPVFIPFSDLVKALSTPAHLVYSLVEMGSNVLLFMPFGFFVAIALPALDRLSRITLWGFGLSLTIETLQFVLPLGRTASATDVVLNTAGTALGFVAYRIFLQHRLPKKPESDTASDLDPAARGRRGA
jgi:glycopeptide antibiotics resistance protein